MNDEIPLLLSTCHDVLEAAMLLLEKEESNWSQPTTKGKSIITFEQDHICANGVDLGVHDLLMYARSILTKEAGINIDVARLKVALEDVIETNQKVMGIEEGARMPSLKDGEEF
jgi:hypothetical protein